MARKHKTTALIVAAGRGKRLGSSIPKQYLKLGKKSVLRHSIDTFLAHEDIENVLVVINPDDEKLYKEATKGLKLSKPVYGGKTRQESVCLGLEAIGSPGNVLIHDAARPFVSGKIISDVIKNLANNDSVVPVIHARDTIKNVEEGKISGTADRKRFAFAQTPQGFHFKTILKAHNDAKGKEFSDDALLVEQSGGKVSTVEGSIGNFKITTEEDFTMAKKIIAGESETRIGMGFDVHKFIDGGSGIIICGVPVPYSRRLEGHSDADVGLHAIADALLGAIGQGDIGLHFPPDDDKWKNADSAVFISHILELLKKKGGQIINIDATIICEEPKIGPYREAMKKNVAEIAKINESRVNIKATTTEGLGFLGRKEGIAAQSVVTVSMPGEQS